MSIHLCASDTRRLAPDPSREVVVWLTIVDLNAYNPVHASGAGAVPGQVHLTPSIEPIDMRHSFAVPGELACPLSEEEIERQAARGRREKEGGGGARDQKAADGSARTRKICRPMLLDARRGAMRLRAGDGLHAVAARDLQERGVARRNGGDARGGRS